jgi:hypothetical protein
MLTRWGVVRVVDTGSGSRIAARAPAPNRERRDPGPQITIAGGGFAGRRQAHYVLPARLPELADAGRASTAVDRLS